MSAATQTWPRHELSGNEQTDVVEVMRPMTTAERLGISWGEPQPPQPAPPNPLAAVEHTLPPASKYFGWIPGAAGAILAKKTQAAKQRYAEALATCYHIGKPDADLVAVIAESMEQGKIEWSTLQKDVKDMEELANAERHLAGYASIKAAMEKLRAEMEKIAAKMRENTNAALVEARKGAKDDNAPEVYQRAEDEARSNNARPAAKLANFSGAFEIMRKRLIPAEAVALKVFNLRADLSARGIVIAEGK